jgi:tetratricopeptide (TPR) repeat protein
MIYKIFIILLISVQFSFSMDWIDENIELTINGKFNQALSLIEQKIQNDTSNYEAYFYLAATLNSKMAHFENFEFEEDFMSAINQTINLINQRQMENIEISDSLNSQYLFYLGSSYGYRGYFEGRKGNWYSALSDGMKATNLLEQAVELDSTLYKAYLGIGTYDYWSSSKIKFVLWIPFISDNRDEGIAMIRKSLLEKGPAKYMAMHQLVYILIDYGMYEDALVYADKIIKAYPESQFMWWAYSHVYYKMRNYEKAINAYKVLLNLVLKDKQANPAHIIKCNLKLAQLYYESSNYLECINQCNNILNYEDSDLISEHLENEISEATEYYQLSIEKISNK